MGSQKEKGKKAPISVSLNIDVIRALDEFCAVNFNAERSAVVERAVRKFLEEARRGEHP